MQRIVGVVQNYDWGDRSAIATILGVDPTGLPEAEYWLGAHPKAPSKVGGSQAGVDVARTLDEAISGDLDGTIGPESASSFGQLPFLLKILAADQPLSIQAHPSLEQAKLGFACEEAAGVDIGARERSYRDANHKPELICAITPFVAKCGFKPPRVSAELFKNLQHHDLAELVTRLTKQDDTEEETLRGIVEWLLRLGDDDAKRLTEATVTAASALDSMGLGVAARSELSWAVEMYRHFPGDIGIVVALLLNHVELSPGQAIFLSAGNLHCYLKGTGVELMANSDNVLRGGLTPKHIDIDELVQVVSYVPGAPPVQTATGSVHDFAIPVPEFALTRLDSTSAVLADQTFSVDGPEIVLVTDGEVTLTADSSSIRLSKGAAAFVSFSDRSYTLIDEAPGQTLAWRATVGSTN